MSDQRTLYDETGQEPPKADHTPEDQKSDALFAQESLFQFDDVKPGEFEVFNQATILAASFQHFRKKGFPFRKLPLHVQMQELNQLANVADENLFGTNLGYKIADTYHPHRFEGHADGMMSPLTAFQDDKLLMRALQKSLEYGAQLGEDLPSFMLIVSGVQACANFRPGIACKMYRDYCKKGARVLDTSTGYGGRLVGFMASGIAGEYIGVDPSTLTHEGNSKMARALGFQDNIRLINQPAEEVDVSDFANTCDFAFTSPPYFRKEHYSTEVTQSYLRHKYYLGWKKGFLIPMLQLQFDALRPGGINIVNIADVTLNRNANERTHASKMLKDQKRKVYPLVNDTWNAAVNEIGFVGVKRDQLLLGQRVGANQKEMQAVESLLIFKKP